MQKWLAITKFEPPHSRRGRIEMVGMEVVALPRGIP